MALMKNATGNVYKNVRPNKVDDYLRKGFIICEDGGGNTPPLTPLQDEVKPTLQEVLQEVEPKEDESSVAPATIVDEFNPIILSNGLYLTQINTKPKLAQAFKELGIDYDYQKETKEDFIRKRDAHIADYKANKRKG
jgi:hypothetical protein